MPVRPSGFNHGVQVRLHASARTSLRLESLTPIGSPTSTLPF
jgi:hypothetical protein